MCQECVYVTRERVFSVIAAIIISFGHNLLCYSRRIYYTPGPDWKQGVSFSLFHLSSSKMIML